MYLPQEPKVVGMGRGLWGPSDRVGGLYPGCQGRCRARIHRPKGTCLSCRVSYYPLEPEELPGRGDLVCRARAHEVGWAYRPQKPKVAA